MTYIKITEFVKKYKSQIWIHTLCWILYFWFEASIIIILGIPVFFVNRLLLFIIYISTFYTSTFVFYPLFLRRKKFVALFLSITSLTIVSVLYRFVIEFHVLPYFNIPVWGEKKLNFTLYFAENFWQITTYLVYGLAYWYGYEKYRIESKKRKLEERRRFNESKMREQERQIYTLENQLKESQMSYLRSQINPHFLYNSLNFFYSKVYSHSKEAADGILLLVEIFKYALDENNGTEKVALEKEVVHLQNYIAFNQLRYNQTLNIHFECTGNIKFRQMLPLVMVTFLENVFKHGDLHDPMNIATVSVNVERDVLHFSTKNKIRYGSKEHSTGIGLDNTIKRLDIAYPDKYTLTIDNDDVFYTVYLIINL
jgi:two-component system, LytTR family, sensor kinase